MKRGDVILVNFPFTDQNINIGRDKGSRLNTTSPIKKNTDKIRRLTPPASRPLTRQATLPGRRDRCR